MKKTTLAWITIPYIVSLTYIHADMGSFKPRGLFGSVEYGYTQQNASNSVNESSQSSLTQNYMLGMRGSIYSPNLLSYSLQGSFFVNDSENSSNGETMETTTKNTNYRINTDFIRATKYPFSFYGEKTSSPYSSMQPSLSQMSNQSTQRYGMSGSVDLPYFMLRYSAESSEMQRDESFANEMRNNKDYMVSIYKNFSEGTFSAVYNDRNRDYLRDDSQFQSHQEWSDRTRDARVNGTWKVDKTLNIGSYLTYMDNSYSDMISLTGNINANWRPSDRYSAGVDVTASSMEAGGYKNDTVMVGGNSYYQVTPEFSTTQNVSLYRVSGDDIDQMMGTLMLGGRYNKTLENDVTLTTSVDLMGKSEHSSVASDMNVSIPDRNSYSYTIASGASKAIELMRSSISANVSYYSSTSTLDEKMERLTANMMLNSTILDNLTYTLSGYYVNEESLYYSGAEGETTQRNSEMISIDTMLRYWQNVGYDGRVSLGGGVSYTVSQADNSERVTRIFPRVDGSFSYNFFNALFFNSTVSASQDSMSDLTNYSASMGLNYTLRKIMISSEARYFLQTGGTLQGSTQNSVFLRMSRRF